MKIRIKFRKYGVMKFIGHLDIMRYFQKAMRRADIDICYSTGFSPHMIMSFAAPLGVGITSDGEYFDIEVNSTKSSAEAMKAFNDTKVEGVEVSGYVLLPDNAKTAMSIVAAADYELSFKDGYDVPASKEAFETAIEAFFTNAKEVIITKQTKKSEKTMDLKPLVYDFSMREKEGNPVFYLKLSTGSNDNVKPELVVEALFDHMGLNYNPSAIQIHRIDVYAAGDTVNSFISLGDMGNVIL